MNKTINFVLLLIFIGFNQTLIGQDSKTEEYEFLWDFSQPKSIVYSYEKEVSAKNDFQEHYSEAIMTAITQIKVNVKTDETAEVVTSATNNIIHEVEDGEIGNEMEIPMPAIVLQGYQANNTFKYPSNRI